MLVSHGRTRRVFLRTVGILMAPAARRFLHRLHLEIALEGDPASGKEPTS